MEPLKLCYPNDWPLYMDKDEFNWFLFAKKIWSEKGKFYYLKFPPTVLLYEEKTGKTYLPQTKIKLLLLNAKPSEEALKSLTYIVHEYSLQGLAFIDETQKCRFPICRKVTLYMNATVSHSYPQSGDSYIISDNLKQVKVCHSCPIIKFSRKNNSYIRQTLGIKKFPTCKEIDQLLSNNPCPEVCKLLYSYLLKYN